MLVRINKQSLDVACGLFVEWTILTLELAIRLTCSREQCVGELHSELLTRSAFVFGEAFDGCLTDDSKCNQGPSGGVRER